MSVVLAVVHSSQVFVVNSCLYFRNGFKSENLIAQSFVVRQHAMRAKHDIVMANPSVHLSVCLSDASIVSI